MAQPQAQPKTKMKTTQNDGSVEAFLATVPDEGPRSDCAQLIKLMSAASKCEPKMWGGAIVGFGTYRYAYANGSVGEICLIGFSPRKQNLVLYVIGDHERHTDLFDKLGKYKSGKGCIYLKRLGDLHLPTFKQLLARAVKLRKQASL